MIKNYKLDNIDKKILNILKDNGRIQWWEIGEEIHMTGQAVGERIKKLTQLGIIKGYHVTLDPSINENINVDYVTIIMTSGNHTGFLELVSKLPEITEVYKTSGHGCYLIRIETYKRELFDKILQNILPFGNYQVSSVIIKVK